MCVGSDMCMKERERGERQLMGEGQKRENEQKPKDLQKIKRIRHIYRVIYTRNILGWSGDINIFNISKNNYI